MSPPEAGEQPLAVMSSKISTPTEVACAVAAADRGERAYLANNATPVKRPPAALTDALTRGAWWWETGDRALIAIVGGFAFRRRAQQSNVATTAGSSLTPPPGPSGS